MYCSNGDLRHSASGPNGWEYSCPKCGTVMVWRVSELPTEMRKRVETTLPGAVYRMIDAEVAQ